MKNLKSFGGILPLGGGRTRARAAELLPFLFNCRQGDGRYANGQRYGARVGAASLKIKIM